jgi:hypothetical protein
LWLARHHNNRAIPADFDAGDLKPSRYQRLRGSCQIGFLETGRTAHRNYPLSIVVHTYVQIE